MHIITIYSGIYVCKSHGCLHILCCSEEFFTGSLGKQLSLMHRLHLEIELLLLVKGGWLLV